jgi:hypothetical protein
MVGLVRTVEMREMDAAMVESIRGAGWMHKMFQFVLGCQWK